MQKLYQLKYVGLPSLEYRYVYIMYENFVKYDHFP